MQKMFDKSKITNVLQDLQLLTKQQAEDRNELKKSTDRVKSEIKDDLAKVLYRLETKCLSEVQTKFDDTDREIERAIRSNRELLIEMVKRQDAILSQNPVQKFVYAKILEKKMSEAKPLIEKAFKTKREMLKFSGNKVLLDTLSKNPTGLVEIKIIPCVSLSCKL